MDTTWPKIKSSQLLYEFIFLGAITPQMALAFLLNHEGCFFLNHTQRHTTVGRTPLDEWLTIRRTLHLTKHNIQNRQTSMPPVGFEPSVSECKRPYSYI